jgi:hypothetical protein
LACFGMGMSGSASFQSVGKLPLRNTWYDDACLRGSTVLRSQSPCSYGRLMGYV